MKVRDLINKLKQTGLHNEVRLIASKESKKDINEDTTPYIYLSFDDVGDVLIYEE